MTQFSLGDAARILKVSPARLRYWQRTALTPAHDEADAEEAAGYDFRDLVSARAVLTLLDSGLPLRRIRKSVEALRTQVPEIDDPLTALRVWSEGSRRVVVRHDGVLLEPGGQMVLDFGEGAAPEEPVSPIDQGREPDLRERAIERFERGCQLDADPSGYEAAIEAYREAIEADPEFADAHCNLGAVLYNQGRRQPARESFERCLELDTGHVEAHFNLANLLEEEGCDELALGHYRSALQSDPLYADLHVNLALLTERLGQRQRSRDHWRLYLQLDPRGSWSEVARSRLADREPSEG